MVQMKEEPIKKLIIAETDKAILLIEGGEPKLFWNIQGERYESGAIFNDPTSIKKPQLGKVDNIPEYARKLIEEWEEIWDEGHIYQKRVRWYFNSEVEMICQDGHKPEFVYREDIKEIEEEEGKKVECSTCGYSFTTTKNFNESVCTALNYG